MICRLSVLAVGVLSDLSFEDFLRLGGMPHIDACE